MSWGMAAVAGATLVSGMMGADAASDAAGMQADAANRANQLSAEQFEAIRSDLAPFKNLGVDSVNSLSGYLRDPNSRLMRDFTGQDLQNDPGYQFGLAEGNKALDRRFAQGGNYFSGAALKGATRFAQDYAGSKFNEAFNRDAANKTRVYNFLSGAANMGQNAAAQTGNAGQTMAQQVGVNTMGAANAAGAAGIAGANAWSGGFNNIAGMYNQNQLLDKIMGGNKGFGYEPWQTSGSGMPPGY